MMNILLCAESPGETVRPYHTSLSEEFIRMRIGHRSWRSLSVIPMLLLALGLSACNLNISAGTPRGTATSDRAPTTSAGTSAGGGQASCEPQTKHDYGSSDYPYTYLSPKQLWTLYGIEPLLKRCYTGKGQSVVVIDSYGSPTLQDDIDHFSDYYGLPRVKLQILSPLGTKTFDPNSQEMIDWAVETTEDVQIIHAIAPAANIVVLTSPVDETEGVAGLPEFLQLEQYAVQHHLGSIVSQSWAASEVSLANSAGQQEIAQWDTFFHTATTQQGVTFFAGSGDDGATDYIDTNLTQLSATPTTSFPTSDPWVTSVGGTTIQQNGAQLSEVAWNNSGGGFSRFYSEPPFQQNLSPNVQQQLNHQRGVPDVSSTADPYIGLGCFFGGLLQEEFAGNGTSAGSPLWAGLTAIANQIAGHPLGYLNPALYKVASGDIYTRDFHDITVGNNSTNDKGVSVTGYDAVVGWDPITGLGTPNAQYLLPDLIAAVNAGG
jgi:subtilase family serine protease